MIGSLASQVLGSQLRFIIFCIQMAFLVQMDAQFMHGSIQFYVEHLVCFVQHKNDKTLFGKKTNSSFDYI
jgi:hypothetical protein